MSAFIPAITAARLTPKGQINAQQAIGALMETVKDLAAASDWGRRIFE